MENLALKEKLKLIPHLPGSYQMYNEEGVIIYVGKAKDLYKRVNSYFNRSLSGKTKIMVSEIADLSYIIAENELEAFLLELNLIKKYDPKYNILLRDDKSYPYIEYISKPYPELKVSRYLKIKKRDNKKLFGPYPNAYAARRMVKLINRLYPLKKCEHLGNKLCLYYHINECLGYCEKLANPELLLKMENDILAILRGNNQIIKDKIMEKINLYQKELNFEACQELKEELNYIDVINEKQKMELHDFVDRDIFNYAIKNDFASIEIFFIRNGKLLGHFSDIIEVTDEINDIFDNYLAKFYTTHEIPKEIVIPKDFNPNLIKQVIDTNFVTPLKGRKKSLLDLVSRNAEINLHNNLEKLNNQLSRTYYANEELKNILGMDFLYRIDAFDNSNLFGDYAVSGMVVYKDGVKSKNDYRKFKVKEDINDDYHTMIEILKRHYSKIDDSEMPQLIIMDGGENQIRAAKIVLKELNLNIKVCGLKKDNHHNTNVLIDDNLKEIPLPKNSKVFNYLTGIQDEVHRFAITYHRTIRSKGVYQSELDNIPGLGPKSRQKLLEHFGSISKIKSASLEEMILVMGKSLGTKIYNYFNGLNDNFIV